MASKARLKKIYIPQAIERAEQLFSSADYRRFDDMSRTELIDHIIHQPSIASTEKVFIKLYGWFDLFMHTCTRHELVMVAMQVEQEWAKVVANSSAKSV
jgi:hypothetical protein